MSLVDAAHDNIVGGATVAERNIIGGNCGHGIGAYISADTRNNRIEGKFTGTDLSGSLDLGNAVSGVRLNAVNGNILQDNLVNWNSCGRTLLGGSSSTQVIANNLQFNQDGAVWADVPGPLPTKAQPVSDARGQLLRWEPA
jgi:hypothetical protein